MTVAELVNNPPTLRDSEGGHFVLDQHEGVKAFDFWLRGEGAKK